MVNIEKILQTMNSWQWGDLIVVRRKKCLGAQSRSILSDPNVTHSDSEQLLYGHLETFLQNSIHHFTSIIHFFM